MYVGELPVVRFIFVQTYQVLAQNVEVLEQIDIYPLCERTPVS